MLSVLSEWLFNTSGLAPHGYCLLWEPGLIWLYAISDGAIALAYFSIPLTLVIIGRRRGDLVFRPMLWLFAVFILLCGTTHWLDLATLWAPLYGLQGLVKAATAAASIFTTVALWWSLPYFLSLPSIAQMREANQALLASEERLAHAQKMEAVGQLAGGIAHDFNNLLQVITVSLTVIERQVARGSDEIKPSIESIRKASKTAASLINRMLAFSLRQTLAPRVIAPDRLVAGMEEMLRRTLGPEIELNLRLGGCRWSVNCDPAQLESALLNLAINARDAMPRGGVLAIATADRKLAADQLPDPDARPGDYVEIEVADNGVGMSRDVLSRVFEPFFTTKPTGQGTGLGLPQIYGFVKQSGGFARIESSPGQGTRVRIYLPACEAPANPAVEDRPGLDGAAMAGAAHRGKILIVEDQTEVRSQIADALNEIGYTLMEAGDGMAGLRILESPEPLDLMITDVGLPGLSGIRLAEAARVWRPELPILLITGYVGTSLETLRLSPNMEVLRKPFALEDLAARAQALLKRTAAPR